MHLAERPKRAGRVGQQEQYDHLSEVQESFETNQVIIA